MSRILVAVFVFGCGLVAAPGQTSISSLSPASVVAGGASFTLNVFGSGFGPLMPIQWNGATQATTFVSSTQLSCTIASSLVATAGTNNVRVRITAFPPSFTSTLVFTVSNPAPVLASLTPSTLTVGALGASLVLGGSGFIAASTIMCGTTPLSVSSFTATSITAFVPAVAISAAGNFAVTVSNPSPGGGTSGAQTLTVTNPTPAITSLNPAQVFAGSPSTTVTVNGSGFLALSVVRRNGVDLATTFVSATQLTAVVPAADMASANAATLTAFNPAPGGGSSAGATFSVVDHAVPTVSSVTPGTFVIPSASISVTVFGTGFDPSTVIRLDGVDRPTTFISASSVNASLSAALLSPAGPHSVTAFNPAPGGGLSNAVSISSLNPIPVASFLSTSIVVGGLPENIAVFGSAFVSSSVVRVGGVPVPTTFVTSSHLIAAIPGTALGNVGTVMVSVQTPAPGGGTSASLPLTVTGHAAPSIATLSPATITANFTGGAITVIGVGFDVFSSVLIDGAPCPTTFQGASQLAVAIPASMMGVPRVATASVVNPAPGGGTSNTATFTIAAPVPVLGAITPSSLLGGQAAAAMTLAGSGFLPVSAVFVDDAPLPTTSVTASSIQITLPASFMTASGLRSFRVVNPGPGGGASVSGIVSVFGPAITSVSPATIPPLTSGAPPVQFTLTGLFPQPVSLVRANGVALPSTWVNAATMTCSVDASFAPALALGGFALTVEQQLVGLGPTCSNAVAVAVAVGSAGSPDNAGSVTVVPRPAAPNEEFFLRVETPVVGQPTTIVADFTQTTSIPLSFAPGFDVVAGVFFGTPFPLVDGLGLFGPPSASVLRADNMTGQGVPGPRGVFDLRGLVAPPVPFGISFQLQAIYLDPSQPLGFNVTHVNPQSL